MLTLVVARYNEDVSWVNLIPANIVIVNKAQLGNTGREASSYLWFIATHFPALQEDYLFCQADPFPHCPDFIEQVNALARGDARPTSFGPRVTCDWNGAPHHPHLAVGALAKEQLDLKLPAELEFTAGAQFLRTAEEIKAGLCTRGFIRHALKIANEHPQAPWIFERLWDYLIPRQAAAAPAN